MDSIASYLSNELFSKNAEGLKLQIESLRLWKVLLYYNLGLDYFRSVLYFLFFFMKEQFIYLLLKCRLFSEIIFSRNI